MAQTLSEISVEQFTPTSRDSLTQQHMDAILDAAGIVPSKWRIDAHKDYEGYLTILITARDPDTVGSTFVLWGREQHIELAELLGNDNLCHRGCFRTIKDAASALAAAT